MQLSPSDPAGRDALIERDAHSRLVLMGGIDPQISILNYGIVGARYRAGIQRLFRDPVTHPEEEDAWKALRSADDEAKRQAFLDQIWTVRNHAEKVG